MYLLGLYWFTGSVLTSDLLNGTDLRDTCDVYQPDGTYRTVTGSDCVEEGLEKARTMAFITIVFSEIFRALTVKSLDPIYVGLGDNRWLLLAVVVSALLAILILFTPGLSDVFRSSAYVPSCLLYSATKAVCIELAPHVVCLFVLFFLFFCVCGFACNSLVGLELAWWAWLTSIALVFVTVLYDEFIKYQVRRADRKRTEQHQVHQWFLTMQGEMRQLRHHLVDLETSMKQREEQPSRQTVIQESAKALADALAAHGIGSDAVHRLALEDQRP